MKYATRVTTSKKRHALSVSMLMGLALMIFAPNIARAGYRPIEPLASAAHHESALEASDGEVWVTSQGTHRLFVLDDQGSLMETIALPPGAGPHITTFSPSSRFAYVSGMGDGHLYVLDADTHQIIQTLNFASTLTHQAKPSPDGSILLVSNIATKTLFKVVVNESASSWSIAPERLVLDRAPICTIFRNDGQRAYVSLFGSGIVIVDVPTMTEISRLATDGFVACGMIKSHNGKTVNVASSGGGGHIYRLDTAIDILEDAGTLGAADWHSFNMSPNEKLGFGSSPHSDELILADLTGTIASLLSMTALDATPGIGNDQPDALAVRGNRVYVSLRASGKLAIVKVKRQTVKNVKYIDLSPPAPFNEANCGPLQGVGGCAVHGVTVRR